MLPFATALSMRSLSIALFVLAVKIENVLLSIVAAE